MKDKKYCVSCDSDFYNHGNNSTTGECWNFKTAKVVKLIAIEWWTPQDKKDNFYEITTHDCHTESGSRAFYKELPKHLKE